MLELKDIFGNTLQQVPDIATAMAAAATMPQIVDIHDEFTGDTWSRSPGWGRLNNWVWHWEGW